jgi:hypothetical protein
MVRVIIHLLDFRDHYNHGGGTPSPDKVFAFGHDGDGKRVKKEPVTLASGAVYSGEWRDGLRDGEGT